MTIPGLSLYSRSSKCGTRRLFVFGLILETILSYSLRTYWSFIAILLEFNPPAKARFLHSQGISIPILDKHLASLIKVRISEFKIDIEFVTSWVSDDQGGLESCLSFLNFVGTKLVSRTDSNAKRTYPVLLYLMISFLASFL